MDYFCYICSHFAEIIEFNKLIYCMDCGEGFVEQISAGQSELSNHTVGQNVSDHAGRSSFDELFQGINIQIMRQRISELVANMNHSVSSQTSISSSSSNSTLDVTDLSLSSSSSNSDATSPHYIQPTTAHIRRFAISSPVTRRQLSSLNTFRAQRHREVRQNTAFDRFNLRTNRVARISLEDRNSVKDMVGLPMSIVSQNQVDNSAQCVTCMEAFDLEEEVAQLDCEHIFHRRCILPWLKRSKTCPICRRIVEPKNWPSATSRL